MYMCGARLGFFQGDVRKLMDDIKELQPTLFPCVPRLLNRFYDKVSDVCVCVCVAVMHVEGRVRVMCALFVCILWASVRTPM